MLQRTQPCTNSNNNRVCKLIYLHTKTLHLIVQIKSLFAIPMKSVASYNRVQATTPFSLASHQRPIEPLRDDHTCYTCQSKHMTRNYYHTELETHRKQLVTDKGVAQATGSTNPIHQSSRTMDIRTLRPHNQKEIKRLVKGSRIKEPRNHRVPRNNISFGNFIEQAAGIGIQPALQAHQKNPVPNVTQTHFQPCAETGLSRPGLTKGRCKQ